MNGSTVGEIAEKRKIKTSTVESYLIEAFSLGLPLDPSRLGVTDEIVEEVEKATKSVSASGLKVLKEALPSHYSYEKIKLSLAIIKQRNQQPK
mmetsp:Transcript_13969/g.19299  ORF Transcript_13969/g.19299 Transcript_13969/m.19299 type:complete len:93 (-) Transcript_13969:79-357(-)